MDARGIDVVELLASDRIRALPARVERPFCCLLIEDLVPAGGQGDIRLSEEIEADGDQLLASDL
ncbi:hypothetical protein [Rhizobium laguerreae]|uniref:hypothetical protein n=1 Tax=Rhizobium laguerreae TaxID=1076926 RepID=UPI001FEC6C99|nr:hypothetical protein [Rhizobium laguerreae]